MIPITLLGLFPNIQPELLGGVETSGRLAWGALARHLSAHGKRAMLFCYERNSHDRRTDDPPRLPARSKLGAIWRLLRLAEQPRVILVWHLGLLKLVPLLRAPQAQIILFLHGIEAWRVQDQITQRVLKRVNLVLANSHSTYERFLKFVPRACSISSRIVPLGIETPLDCIAPPTSPPCMLMLSRLERAEDYKGHREMIAAWSRVRVQIPDAQLWIAGDGNLRAELQAQVAALGLQGAVRFWGRVDDLKKQELMQACRAFALPSRREGFGLVYLEAMRAGRPCLVSTVDAGREVVNPPEAGLAADPGNANALADAACCLLKDDSSWDEWSMQARRRYENHFTALHFQQRLKDAVLPFVA